MYSTYLGGVAYDQGGGIAVDSKGSAYVTGYTTSVDFPAKDAFQPALAGDRDVVIFKLTQAPEPSRPKRGFDFRKYVDVDIHLLSD